MILSTLSTSTIEEVAEAGGESSHRWFQLYIYKDRGLTEQLVRRAEAAGYSAIVLTVDAAVSDQRLGAKRFKLAFPAHITVANFADARAESANEATDGSRMSGHIGALFDPGQTWADVAWLRSISRLPLLLKGILTGESRKLEFTKCVHWFSSENQVDASGYLFMRIR